MLQRKYLLSLFLYGSVFGLFALIFGITSSIESALILFFYTILLYGLQTLWYKIRRKPKNSFRDFGKMFLVKSSIFLSFFFLIFGGFLVYQNELSPATLPKYTLTNTEKTIEFQTMSHIASPSFYTQVRENITEAKKQGSILMYEGVKPGTKENMEAFNAALGIEFDAELYTSFSKLYGIVAQDNALFLGLGNTPDINQDLNMDEVMELYRKKYPEVSEKSSQDIQTTQLSSELIDTLAQRNPRELRVLQYINQALLNMIIKNQALRDIIISKLGNADIFHVILHERNEYLVQGILASDEKNIFIIYGLMHFDGVLGLLQAADSRWKIVNQEEFQVIEFQTEATKKVGYTVQ